MKTSKQSLFILTFVLLVVMLGYGIIIPILPFYIEKMGAGGTELGLLVASYAVMRLIFGPIWGGISDYIGRKPVLLIGIFGYAVTMLWFGLATQLWMLFAARILSGVLSSATAPTTMAFIGDSTSKSERSAGMGLLGAAGGIGAILGPVFGGFLAGDSLATPFFLAAGLAVLSLVLAAILLPESLPKKDHPVSKHLFEPGAWWEAVTHSIGHFLTLTFISTSGLMIFSGVFGLYGLARFDYGPKDVGVVMMVLGAVSAVTQGVIAGPSSKKWGDEQIVQFTFLANAIAFIFLLLANNFWSVMLATAFFAFTIAIQVPALTSLTSQKTELAQGIAMGLSNAFVSLGRIVGPLIGGYAFDVNIQFPFIGGATIMFLGFIISLIYFRPSTKII